MSFIIVFVLLNLLNSTIPFVIHMINTRSQTSNPLITLPIRNAPAPAPATEKIITISPGGLKGFYTMGVAMYIYKHYNISDYIVSGSSSGSWNAFAMTYCGKPDLLPRIRKIITEANVFLQNNTIYELFYNLKQQIICEFTEDEFELSRLKVGITVLNMTTFSFQKEIVSNFTTMDEALTACIASSFVPFVMGGGWKHYYRGQLTFDGGFSNYPYYNSIVKPILHIHPNIWMSNITLKFQLESITTILSKNKYNLINTFDDGYRDTQKNKNILFRIFQNH